MWRNELTDKFAEELNNIEATICFLFTYCGRLYIEDIQTSNAFSRLQENIVDLVAHNHYARFQEHAHKYTWAFSLNRQGRMPVR